MNAVEIADAVAELAEAPFDPAEFPFVFLAAFGNKETTLKRLRGKSTNKSDLAGGVLQRNNIHIQVCPPGQVTAALAALHNSPATTAQKQPGKTRRLFAIDDEGCVSVRHAEFTNAYLVAQQNAWIAQARVPDSGVSQMLFGNMPRDGGNFILGDDEKEKVIRRHPEISKCVRKFLGSVEMIQGKIRWCIWIEDEDAEFARGHEFLRDVLHRVGEFRSKSVAASTRSFAQKPHRFVQIAGTAKCHSLAVAKVSSESRPYLPITLLDNNTIVSDLLFALYDAPLWNMSLIASRLHLVWIATVCGKLETRYRYSNTLGWNTFPVPSLSDQNKADLTRCAEEILLAREAHFPATIADLYDPEAMPADLRAAHDRNDETLERIYIGRRFKNDTERLETLFEMYTKMTAGKVEKKKGAKREPRTK